MTKHLEQLWYGKHPLQNVLRPLSWIFRGTSSIRRWYLQHFCQITSTVPVIVVGNISVGGVGKTPFVIALAQQLQAKGLRVGIVSRGYGAKITDFPYEIQQTDSAAQVGDEPLLLALKTGCPVVIAPKRPEAVNYLIEKKKCQIIISDDGLQHYRMGRAIEIAIIDGTRGLGNGLCLPAGPLRESAGRLKEVDFIVVNEGQWTNAFAMSLKPGKIKQLSTEVEVSPESLNGQVAAVAAIGNPRRFYSLLQELGIKFTAYAYPDHYQFKPDDLDYQESQVLMTEKDAVKCRSFQSDKMYYLPVEAVLQEGFWDVLWSHPQLKGYL